MRMGNLSERELVVDDFEIFFGKSSAYSAGGLEEFEVGIIASEEEWAI